VAFGIFHLFVAYALLIVFPEYFWWVQSLSSLRTKLKGWEANPHCNHVGCILHRIKYPSPLKCLGLLFTYTMPPHHCRVGRLTHNAAMLSVSYIGSNVTIHSNVETYFYHALYPIKKHACKESCHKVTLCTTTQYPFYSLLTQPFLVLIWLFEFLS